MKNYSTFDDSQRLFKKGIVFNEPSFGDVFYTIHPDTNQVDTVVVGSAKYHISAMLPMFRAPSLGDLMQMLGDDFAIRFEKSRNSWVLEKQRSVSFQVEEVDY